MTDTPIQRFISMAEVVRLTTLSRSTIYRSIAAGTFPKPDRLGPNRIAWPESDILNWQNNLANLPPSSSP